MNKKWINKFLFIVLTVFILAPAQAKKQSKSKSSSLKSKSSSPAITLVASEPKLRIKIPSTIRVLLKEFPLDEENSFDISAPENVVVYDAANPTTRVAYPYHNMHLFLKDSTLFVKDPKGRIRPVKKDVITISCEPQNLSVNSVPYQGLLTLKIDRTAKTLQLINTVQLEDYIYGVLRCESFQSWPHEMQKVQAIASRSFAVYHILNARATKQPFDLKNSNFHQTYRGTHEFEHLRQAVDETAGTILTHDGKVALAMFDACCGGVVPAHMKSPNFKEAPYLARKQPCTHCSEYKLYTWQYTIELSELLKKCSAHKTLGEQVKGLGTLKDLHICEKDKAGVIHKLKLVGSRKNVMITARSLYNIQNPELKSLSFSVKKEGSRLTLNGAGFGHFLGLCQRGARSLVKQGWTAPKILSFYYPQTTLYRHQT